MGATAGGAVQLTLLTCTPLDEMAKSDAVMSFWKNGVAPLLCTLLECAWAQAGSSRPVLAPVITELLCCSFLKQIVSVYGYSSSVAHLRAIV